MGSVLILLPDSYTPATATPNFSTMGIDQATATPPSRSLTEIAPPPLNKRGR